MDRNVMLYIAIAVLIVLLYLILLGECQYNVDYEGFANEDEVKYLITKRDAGRLLSCVKSADTSTQERESCALKILKPKEVHLKKQYNPSINQSNNIIRSSHLDYSKKMYDPGMPSANINTNEQKQNVHYRYPMDFTMTNGDCIDPATHPEKEILNVSWAECANNCQNQNSCNGFSFDPNNKRCVLKMGPRIDPAKCGVNNGYKHYWKNSRTKFTQANDDCIANGHPETVYLNAPSNDYCMSLCSNDPKCDGFSYSKVAERCVLKSGGAVPDNMCGNKNGYTHFKKAAQ